MTMYEYKCPECDRRYSSHIRGDTLMPRLHCECGHPGPFRRVFGFSHKPGMHDHFNTTVGAPISSMDQFTSALSRKSDEANVESAQMAEFLNRELGQNVQPTEHNYKPIDMSDSDAVGATMEGIDESNVIRSRKGEPLLPEF